MEELENLRGIFIATTNLVENMDSAFERRFLFKIKFENPSTEAKAAIWTSKLPWLGEEAASE
ncbi:MAG: AAA family ATPase, partial [Treponema sp.]|nr:AAA family ATPase [Treponema sp.]